MDPKSLPTETEIVKEAEEMTEYKAVQMFFNRLDMVEVYEESYPGFHENLIKKMEEVPLIMEHPDFRVQAVAFDHLIRGFLH